MPAVLGLKPSASPEHLSFLKVSALHLLQISFNLKLKVAGKPAATLQ